MMLFSQLVYLGFAYLLESGLIAFEFPDSGDANIFALVLGFVSLSILVVSTVLPSRLKVPPFQQEIVRFAMLESIGLFGLLFMLQTGEFEKSLVFFGVSLVALLVARPNANATL